MSCSDVLGVWLVTDAVCHPSAVRSELGLLLLLHSPSSLQCDPALLPEPNHVMLNHLYALSIKVRGQGMSYTWEAWVSDRGTCSLVFPPL